MCTWFDYYCFYFERKKNSPPHSIDNIKLINASIYIFLQMQAWCETSDVTRTSSTIPSTSTYHQKKAFQIRLHNLIPQTMICHRRLPTRRQSSQPTDLWNRFNRWTIIRISHQRPNHRPPTWWHPHESHQTTSDIVYTECDRANNQFNKHLCNCKYV